jgi:hypothetical protein
MAARFTPGVVPRSNYLILGAASGCGFLMVSLRLMPSVDGFLLILLHVLTVTVAVAGCAIIATLEPLRGRCYTVHMAATVVVSLQGAAAVLAFSRTAEFFTTVAQWRTSLNSRAFN